MSEIGEAEKSRDPTAGASDGGLQISAMIDKIMANPELISMVASALGGNHSESKDGENVSSEVAEAGSESVETVGADVPSVANMPSMDKLPELVAAIAPMLSSSGGKSVSAGKVGAPRDKRACLLVALKPYLSRERCEAVDYMIRLGALSEIFRGLGG
ncbi:MAG: hypothetical protein IJV72_01680 [Clostridia bacterium]|nr:hypothetical protein [Clostridia bacterium]